MYLLKIVSPATLPSPARDGWQITTDPINMLELFTTDSGNNDMQLGKGDKPSDSAPDWTDYNKLIKEIRTTADFSKRVDLMHQAEDMLMDTGAVMPITTTMIFIC